MKFNILISNLYFSLYASLLYLMNNEDPFQVTYYLDDMSQCLVPTLLKAIVIGKVMFASIVDILTTSQV